MKSTRSSTERDVFVDTSGYYALLAGGDDAHDAATAFLNRARRDRRRFITTDYVLDETVTLLLARGLRDQVQVVLDASLHSAACTVAWSSPDLFEKTAAFLHQHIDHGWSFTDCMSFLVMKERGLTHALTKDVHFKQAGFLPVLR